MLRWFLDAVIDHRAPDVERMITRAPRLQIYQYAYRARLVECLADDYPCVKHALGEAEFEALAHRYIAAHPSRSPSLNYYGAKFPQFCEGFIADLARLEWAMVEVLHAPPSPVLSMTMMQSLPPEAWEEIRFEAAPTLRFHQFSFPVNKYLRAVRMGESPSIPTPEWAATAIYRKEFTIWRMDFTEPMAEVLLALLAGQPLGDALSSLPEELEGDVMIWFKEWVAGGFFERIHLPA
jgi:hypothetical protein